MELFQGRLGRRRFLVYEILVSVATIAALSSVAGGAVGSFAADAANGPAIAVVLIVNVVLRWSFAVRRARDAGRFMQLAHLAALVNAFNAVAFVMGYNAGYSSLTLSGGLLGVLVWLRLLTASPRQGVRKAGASPRRPADDGGPRGTGLNALTGEDLVARAAQLAATNGPPPTSGAAPLGAGSSGVYGVVAGSPAPSVGFGKRRR